MAKKYQIVFNVELEDPMTFEDEKSHPMTVQDLQAMSIQFAKVIEGELSWVGNVTAKVTALNEMREHT
jgi:hypothetical protein